MSISGFTCGNCGYHSDEHVNDGQCLFSPTKYRMMTAVELLHARETERWGEMPPARKLSVKWAAHQVQGVGIGNIRSVSKLSLPANLPSIVTVSGTDQFGNAVTEEL